jgi:EpsI family protein
MTLPRTFIVLTLLAVTVVVTQSRHRNTPVSGASIGSVPLTIEGWSGRDAGALDDETVRILAADAYVNRTYQSGVKTPIGLYVAYYAEQRPGVSIHSPLHCLPGTGWEPVEVATRSVVRSDGTTGAVRRLVVRKARDRAVVLYWYAVHGRMIGNEIASKAWLLHDSLLFGRSDAALVRIVVPVNGSVDAAEGEALAFARGLVTYVDHLWS